MPHVSTSSAEPASSAMKLLEIYIWSSMTDERLTGLVLMHINPRVEIDIQEVCRFAAMPAKAQTQSKQGRHTMVIVPLNLHIALDLRSLI